MCDVALRDRSTGQRTGLTLLELVVVMAILVALAALLVPLLPEFMGKANQSAAATNINELEKAIQTFRTTYSRQPNYFDSLLSNDTTLSSLLPSNTTGVAGGAITTLELKIGPRSRLTREGINTLHDLNGTATEEHFHATLNPYGTTLTNRTIASGKNSPNVTVAALASSTSVPGLILNEDHEYVLFGIGKYCNLCGPDGLVKEAPVYGHHAQENTPSTVYQRFAVLYDVGANDTDTDRYNAKFIGIVAIGSDGLFSCGDLVGTYGDNRYDASVPRK